MSAPRRSGMLARRRASGGPARDRRGLRRARSRRRSAAEGVAWRLEQPQPPAPPVGVPPADHSDRSRQRRRHRVLGAQPRAADHRRATAARSRPGCGRTTARTGTSSRRSAERPTGASPGRDPTNSGRSPTDGPGRPPIPKTNRPAPIEDNTLCHFAAGDVVGSYGSPAFQASSYQPMHAAGCISPSDCWFGGDPLPKPQAGEAFHLHWNGSTLTAEPTRKGTPSRTCACSKATCYESVRSPQATCDAEDESPLSVGPARDLSGGRHAAVRIGASARRRLLRDGEFPGALSFLRLWADEDALWAAAGPGARTARRLRPPAR